MKLDAHARRDTVQDMALAKRMNAELKEALSARAGAPAPPESIWRAAEVSNTITPPPRGAAEDDAGPMGVVPRAPRAPRTAALAALVALAVLGGAVLALAGEEDEPDAVVGGDASRSTGPATVEAGPSDGPPASAANPPSDEDGPAEPAFVAPGARLDRPAHDPSPPEGSEGPADEGGARGTLAPTGGASPRLRRARRRRSANESTADPEATESRLARARACMMAGDNACAIRALRGSRDERGMAILVETYRSMGRIDDATAAARRYVRAHPSGRRAHGYRRIFLSSGEDREEEAAD